jgi:hypothetical protein
MVMKSMMQLGEGSKVTVFDKREKSLSTMDAINQTKQERSMLNYKRYLDLWDKHEGRVRNHFDE